MTSVYVHLTQTYYIQYLSQKILNCLSVVFFSVPFHIFFSHLFYGTDLFTISLQHILLIIHICYISYSFFSFISQPLFHSFFFLHLSSLFMFISIFLRLHVLHHNSLVVVPIPCSFLLSAHFLLPFSLSCISCLHTLNSCPSSKLLSFEIR